MKKISRQRVYERVREHFTQPGAVYGFDKKGGVCVYRGGLDPKSPIRCSVGVIIPDSRYGGNREKWQYDTPDGLVVEAHFADQAISAAGYDTSYDNLGEFVADMQKIHDEHALPTVTRPFERKARARKMSTFIKALDQFAKDQGLKVVNG